MEMGPQGLWPHLRRPHGRSMGKTAAEDRQMTADDQDPVCGWCAWWVFGHEDPERQVGLGWCHCPESGWFHLKLPADETACEYFSEADA